MTRIAPVFNSVVRSPLGFSAGAESPVKARNAPGPVWCVYRTSDERAFIVELDPANDFTPIRIATSPKSAIDGVGGDRNVVWAAAVKPNPGEELPNWVGRLSPDAWTPHPWNKLDGYLIFDVDRGARTVAERNYVGYGGQQVPPEIHSIGGDHENIYAISALWDSGRRARLPFLQRLWPENFDLGFPRRPPPGFVTSSGSSLMASIGGSVDVCWLGGKSGREEDPNIAELDTYYFNALRTERIPDVGAFIGIGGSRDVIWALGITPDGLMVFEIDPPTFKVRRQEPLPPIGIHRGVRDYDLANPIALGGA